MATGYVFDEIFTKHNLPGHPENAQRLLAIMDYLAENQIQWVNLAGEETQGLARKYNVKGIPTMMLVDAAGQIVAVSHNIDDLSARVDKLLEAS